eukprot:scaffold1431_cov125-Isochrysis_galbana.AAC.3
MDLVYSRGKAASERRETRQLAVRGRLIRIIHSFALPTPRGGVIGKTSRTTGAGWGGASSSSGENAF